MHTRRPTTAFKLEDLYCGGVPWSPTKSHDLGGVELGWVS